MRKLVTLGTRNRSLFLPKIQTKIDIDIHQLSVEAQISVEHLLLHLWEEKSVPLVRVAHPTDESANVVSKQLDLLQRKQKLILEEKGTYELRLAYPYVIGKWPSDIPLSAYLLYTNVHLYVAKQGAHPYWYISTVDAPISWNPSFLLAYSYFFETQVDNHLLQTFTEQSFQSLQDFKLKLFTLVKEAFPRIDFNSETLLYTWLPFEPFVVNPKVSLQIRPCGVMGIFSESDSNLYQDFKQLKLHTLPDTIDVIFEEKNNLLKTKGQLKEEDISQVLDSDGYQDEVLYRIAQGFSSVVQGPPGTGKSQLIVNAIATALQSKKNILVVCQKKVALQVLEGRLSQLGLADFVAHVTHPELDRKKLYQSIEKQILNLETYREKNLDFTLLQTERQYSSVCRELNELHDFFEEIKLGLFDAEPFGICYQQIRDVTITNTAPYVLDENLKQYTFDQAAELKKIIQDLIEIEQHYAQLRWDVWRLVPYSVTTEGGLQSWESLWSKYVYMLQSISTAVSVYATREDATKIPKPQDWWMDLFVNKDQADQLLKNIQVLPHPTFTRKEISVYQPLWNTLNQKSTRFPYSWLKKWIWKKHPKYTTAKHWQILGETLSNDATYYSLVDQTIALFDTSELEIDTLAEILNLIDTTASFGLCQYQDFEQCYQLQSWIENHKLQLGTLFYKSVIDNLQNLPELINQWETYKHIIQAYLQVYKSLSSSELLFYNQCRADNFKTDALNYFYTYWKAKIEERYPALRYLDSEILQLRTEKLQGLIETKKRFSREIVQIKARLKTYQDISFNRLQNRITYRELLHQVGKKKKVWSISKLLSQHEEEILRLKPIWLAAPETVSTLFQSKTTFDLVIFDEASQLYTERAFPILCRAKQVLVCGDSNQLQPGDLFSIRWEEYVEGEHADHEIKDSWLDFASDFWASYYLRQHYRSLHPDLIAFSNQYIYHGLLTTFSDYLYLKSKPNSIFYHKTDGIWQQQINQAETKKVVEIVSNYQNQSVQIGIITFNLEQKVFIEQHLREAALSNIEWVVKNLEHVQGDEFDIVILSVGYAPDKRGVLQARFGLLNQLDGANRLNVAITRARKEMHLVTSISAGQLQVEDTLHDGPKLLKKFLDFAETKSKEQSHSNYAPKGLNIQTPDVTLSVKKQLGAAPSAKHFFGYLPLLYRKLHWEPKIVD